jgi:L-lysine 2,3-aminomutase
MFGNSNIKLLQNQLKSKTDDLYNVNRTLQVMEKEINDYKSTIETTATQYENLKMAHSVELEEMKIKIKDTEKSVNLRLNAALASIVVSTFAHEIINTQPATNPQDALKKFTELNGEDKTAYYNENKDLITLALKSHKINKG